MKTIDVLLWILKNPARAWLAIQDAIVAQDIVGAMMAEMQKRQEASWRGRKDVN